MVLSFLIIVILFLLGLIFIVGLILFIVGRLKKDKKLKKVGLILSSIPLSIVFLLMFLSLIREFFSTKPDEGDLVGKYHIVEVTNLEIDKNNFDRYRLEFTGNNKFTLTPTPFIKVCESGNYQIDYKFSFNELTFECPKTGFSTAHIERGFGSFRIEFSIGDPDSKASVFFEKMED